MLSSQSTPSSVEEVVTDEFIASLDSFFKLESYLETLALDQRAEFLLNKIDSTTLNKLLVENKGIDLLVSRIPPEKLFSVMEKIGHDTLVQVLTYHDLCELVKTLPPEAVLPFLNILAKDFVISLLKEDNIFLTFLYAMKEVKVQQEYLAIPYLFSELGKTFMQSHMNTTVKIVSALQAFHPGEQFKLLQTIGFDFIIESMQSKGQYFFILMHISLQDRLPYLLSFTPDFFANEITGIDNLIRILQELQEAERYSFLQHLGKVFLNKTCDGNFLIKSLASYLPAQDRHEFYENFPPTQDHEEQVRPKKIVTVVKAPAVHFSPRATVIPLSPPQPQLSAEDEAALIKAKVELFIKIYRALREGQSGWFKTNWVKTSNIENMPTKDAWKLIQKHSMLNPKSRTADAITILCRQGNTLAQIEKVHTCNLLNQIYCAAFKRSGFFKKSSVIKQVTIYKTSTLQGYNSRGVDFFYHIPPNSRRQKIFDAYKGIEVQTTRNLSKR